MAFSRPVTKTTISTTDFGQPVYDAIIRTGASRSGVQASLPATTYTDLLWTTTSADTGGFVTSTKDITVPSTKAGLYVATVSVVSSASSAGSYITVRMGTARYDIVSPGSRFAASVMQPLNGGDVVFFSIWNGQAGVILTPTSAVCYVYRVGL